MSKISSINSATRSSEISSTVGSSHTPPMGGVSFNEKFNFPDIQLKERSKTNALPEERLNYDTFVKLFVEILQSGVDIVPTLPKDHGEYIVEASFKQSTSKNKHHSIHAPLRGVRETLVAPHMLAINRNLSYTVEQYIEPIFLASTDEDILRLIVVIGHEFGHYLSFIRGNHDNDLKVGLYLLNSKQARAEVAKFTWLVFREESTAWRYAEEVLSRGKFEFWDEFNQVKFNSLQIYFKTLKLEKASLDIYFKLSLLGDDFLKSCNSELFKNGVTQQSVK